ncbi:MAG: hypothetical protein GW809_08755 [Bacteroidetes bacterium]|nr:hypothetical protein [Bacteroidota bacterium]NCQ12210.1 hypothetical protein [Bacteroidota bacterium]
MSDIRRDELISTFRSSVITKNTNNTSELELFQNEVLRPILKFQQPVLIALANNETLLQKQLKKTSSREDFTIVLQSYISKEATFRHVLIGSVIGLFTEIELHFYLKEKKSCNKRILTMISKRITDTASN